MLQYSRYVYIAARLRGFTLIETLITLAVVGGLVLFSIPTMRDYQIRTDLNLAEQQIRQQILSAQMRAQSGTESSAWGVYVQNGMLYKGTNYSSRDTEFDEVFAIAPTVTVTGLRDVAFSPLQGRPLKTGVITLHALNGETREIVVSNTTLPPVGPPTHAQNARMRIVYESVKNQGNGSAEARSFVGTDAVVYEDGEWIDLVKNGQKLTDGGIVIGTTGLAVERGDGFVRVMSHGGLNNGGKEVVDARIEFDGALVDHVENDIGTENETENPFDGNVNNGVGGDEVTTAPDGTWVFFQTRTTNYGDSILIYWNENLPWWLGR